MKIKIIFLCLCVCLCTSISNKVKAQNIADSLFNLKQYADAAIEYEKAYFYNKLEVERVNIIFKKANCEKLSFRYSSEIKTLNRINISKCTDSTVCFAYYEMALANYMINNYAKANELLERAHSLSINNQQYYDCIFLHGLVLDELNEYEFAKTKFKEYFKDRLNAKHAFAVIDSLYADGNIPKLKSIKKARRLSLFLPSAGLFYVKKTSKAITNLSLLLASTLYTAYNVSITNYVTAITSGLYFMKYFYTGGVNQLYTEIPTYNKNISQRFNSSVKQVLIDF